jgi:hypothetical protein
VCAVLVTTVIVVRLAALITHQPVTTSPTVTARITPPSS